MAASDNAKAGELSFTLTFWDHDWEELALFRLEKISRSDMEDVLDEWQDGHAKAMCTFLGPIVPMTMAKHVGIEVHHGE